MGLLAARPAYAIGRCDVHPIGNPDGVVTASDALVILRVSVHLLDASVAPPERADIAPPARPIVAGALIPGGDGTVFAEDALLCLRVAVGLLSIPANLVVAIESISPTRPVTGTTGTARVRVENDGDSDGGAGSTVSLRRGSPFPGPADAVATIEESISPGDARTIDVLFPAGDVAGRIELYALVETSALEIDAEDNVDSLAFEVNGPPIAHAGEDVENALEQTTVALDGSASSDPNDDPGDLSFAWSQKSGSPVNLAGADTANPTFEAPDVSVETRLEFSLRVRDPDDLESQPAMVSVEVVPINDPPTAGAGEDQVDVDELTVVTLTGTADDPNEDPITTLWVQTGGPVVVLDAPNELTTTFTLPDISKDDTFVFELRVTDDENAVGTDALTIAALALNNHPIAAAAVLPSGSVLEATLVTLDGTASSDPDEDDLTFAWSKRAGPDVVLNDDGMGTATFEAPETATSNSSETLHFELLVEDGFGGFDSLEVEVEVRPDPLHPAQVIVRVTPPTALVRDQGETGPTMTVEVEVVPRDPFVLVPDGTPVELSATPFGVLDEVAGVTKLGLFTTKLTSDPQPGETVVRADVPGTSAAGEAHPSFHVSPNEVGRLSLILDPATVVVGSGESVRVAAVAYPADEGIGSVQDATILDFAATGGTFPAGGSAGTIDGVAVVPFEPPTEPGPVEITVAGSAEASATLTVLSNPEAAGAPRLEAEHLTIVAGGAETTVSTFVEPELRGAAVAPTTQVAFRAEPGLLDGDAILVFGKTVMVATDALPEEFDRPPLGDFPGLGDLDADGDGTLDVPGGRVARVTFSHPDPVSEPVQVEIDAVIVGSSMVDSIRITVVPAPTDPGSVALTSRRPAIVAGGTGAMLTASVDAAAGGPVADGTPVEFASSRGLLVPPSQATSVGSASTGLSHSESFDLTARLRARAKSGTVEKLLDLNLVPDEGSPGSIELKLTPTLTPNDGESKVLISAHVRKADGSDVDDGTRVLFDSSSGVPTMALAGTVNGVAEIAMSAAAAPGPLRVDARVAGSVVAGSARAAFAPSRTYTATFNLVNAVGIAALTIEVPFPAGAVPIGDENGVTLDLLLNTNPPPDDGIANAATLAVANDSQDADIVSVGAITFTTITGTGPFLRMSFHLPPGGQLDCDALQPVFFRASDGINEIPGADFVCDHVTRKASPDPK